MPCEFDRSSKDETSGTLIWPSDKKKYLRTLTLFRRSTSVQDLCSISSFDDPCWCYLFLAHCSTSWQDRPLGSNLPITQDLPASKASSAALMHFPRDPRVSWLTWLWLLWKWRSKNVDLPKQGNPTNRTTSGLRFFGAGRRRGVEVGVKAGTISLTNHFNQLTA